MRASVTIRYTETQRPVGMLGPHSANPTCYFQLGSFSPNLPSPSKLVATFFLKLALKRGLESGAHGGLLWHGLCSGSLSILVVPRHAAAPIEVLPINPGRNWEAGTVGDWTVTTKIALGFTCAGSCTEAPPALPSFTSCPSRLLFRKIFESFPVFSCFHRILSSLKAESLLTYGISASC